MPGRDRVVVVQHLLARPGTRTPRRNTARCSRLDLPGARRRPCPPRRSTVRSISGSAATRSRSGARYGVGSGKTAATRIGARASAPPRASPQPAPATRCPRPRAAPASAPRADRGMRRQRGIELERRRSSVRARRPSPSASRAAHGRPRREPRVDRTTAAPASLECARRARRTRRSRVLELLGSTGSPARRARRARPARRQLRRDRCDLAQRDLRWNVALQSRRALRRLPGMHAVEHERLGACCRRRRARAAASRGRSPRSRGARGRSGARAARAARGRRARSGGRTAS